MQRRSHFGPFAPPMRTLRQARFLEYQAAGDPAAITHGDYYGGKGVGLTRLATPVCCLAMFLMHGSRHGSRPAQDRRPQSWHSWYIMTGLFSAGECSFTKKQGVYQYVHSWCNICRCPAQAGLVDMFNTHTCANYAHTYAPPPKGR